MKADDAVAMVVRNPELKAVGLDVESYLELLKSMQPENKFCDVEFPIKEHILIHNKSFFPVYNK